MDGSSSQSKSRHLVVLGAILLLFLLFCAFGIGWGLPSRSVDPYLFAGEEPWSGEKIHRLAGAADKFSQQRGADVDPDPLDKSADHAVALTDTDEKLAKVYLRYRLYTYQPDEMITMMALAGMNPRQLQLDPRLYQYGGLFIYPVGGLVGLCGAVGLIDVRGDVIYYLDNPDEFGKFYVVSRAYAAAWGLIGVLVVFAIGRRLGGTRAGLLAALLFTLMPVVICMAHEGKPHLPGAVLMLLAVYFSMRRLEISNATAVEHRTPEVSNPPSINRDWWLTCICCGAAFGMVLSSWPIMVLIPLVAFLDHQTAGQYRDRKRAANQYRDSFRRPNREREGAALDAQDTQPTPDRAERNAAFYVLRRTILGGLIAAAVYLVTNPYIAINTLTNRAVLASNFGNSLAMYRIDRIGEGLARTLQLTVEGASLPIVALGALMLLIAIARKNRTAIPLAVTAFLFFLQFVCIGAGKPAEYGRFGVFTNTALAIAAACLLTARLPNKQVSWLKPVFAVVVIVWEGWCGAGYAWNFHRDSIDDGSRMRVRRAAPLGPWTGPASQSPTRKRGDNVAKHQSPKRERGDNEATHQYRDHFRRPDREREGAATTTDTLQDGGTNPDPWLTLNEGTAVFVTAEPAPYSCPPLPFHRLDLRLLPDASKIETICSDRPDDCLALRTVDRTPLGPTGPPGIVVQPSPDILPRLTLPGWWLTRRQTPISWANKPIEIWTAGLPFAP